MSTSDPTDPNVPTIAPAPAPTPSGTTAPPGQGRFRRSLMFVMIAAGLAGSAYYLYPRIELALATVSTDDAYVNSHVTQVAPRITENVRSVRVDNNDVVRKGDLLIVLDDEMERVQLRGAEAALEVAERAVDQAFARAQATVAAARANRFKLDAIMAQVRNQTVGLRVAVAKLREAEAAERLARTELQRYEQLAERKSVTKEQADVRRTDFEQAHARVTQAYEEIRSLRAALARPPDPEPGKGLDYVPEKWEQEHPDVRSALGQLLVNLAELGVKIPRLYATAEEFITETRRQAPRGDIDLLIAETVERAPDVKAAQAKVEQAQAQLAQARLDLSYCAISADVDGIVSNRNVNPGDRVTQGQRLLAIRSFEQVWIDCNFKETQLGPIRIGLPAELRVDAYPGKVFRGRVSGFSAGTGAVTALLPAQNATGNFVKIVQRLPVRIDLLEPNPHDTPLFAGLSVEPRIFIRKPPEGPLAGQRLRGSFSPQPTSSPQPGPVAKDHSPTTH